MSRGPLAGQHALVTGDLRTISASQLESAKKTMREIVAAHLPRTGAELTFDDSYPPMAPTDGNRRLLQRLDEVSRDLGFGPVTPVDPRAAAAADISSAAERVGMAIDALGLKGKADHTTDETADLRLLPIQTKRAAILLYRLTRQ